MQMFVDKLKIVLQQSQNSTRHVSISYCTKINKDEIASSL